MASDETNDRVKSVIRACLKIDDDAPIEDAMPLIGGDYDVDSLDILLIVTELEKAFGIKINEGSIGKTTFGSVGTLGDFVEERARAKQSAEA